MKNLKYRIVPYDANGNECQNLIKDFEKKYQAMYYFNYQIGIHKATLINLTTGTQKKLEKL